MLQQYWRVSCCSNAVRRAGEDHRARQQCGAAAEEFNERGYVEDHVAGRPVLHHFAIQRRSNAEIIRIWNLVRRRDARSQRSERVKSFSATPLPLAPLDLPVPRADVIGAGVAQDVVERIAFGDVLASFANHDRQFTLVVNGAAIEVPWQLDGVFRVLNRRAGFHEDAGMLWRIHAALLRMFGVVESDAIKVNRSNGAQQFADFDDGPRVFKLIEDIAFDHCDSVPVIDTKSDPIRCVQKPNYFHRGLDCMKIAKPYLLRSLK